MAIPILKGPSSHPPQLIEVCRSFAYKLNLENHGGPKYESEDFFASRKLTCAREDSAWVSQEIFEECVAEVRAAVAQFIQEMRRKKHARTLGQKETAA